MRKKVVKLLITVGFALALVFAMTACGGEEQAEEASDEGAAVELSQDDIDALMQQVAEQDVELSYEEYMPDIALGNAEVFGVDSDADGGTIYAEICTGEYVDFKDKAYLMSGSQGEVIIKYENSEDGPVLGELIWSADGSDHEAWMEENYPADYLEAARNYEAHNTDGVSVLGAELDKKAEEALGVPVETENLLEIDLEAGTYEVSKVIESGEGEDYTFDTETIDEGSLSDLK